MIMTRRWWWWCRGRWWSSTSPSSSSSSQIQVQEKKEITKECSLFPKRASLTKSLKEKRGEGNQTSIPKQVNSQGSLRRCTRLFEASKECNPVVSFQATSPLLPLLQTYILLQDEWSEVFMQQKCPFNSSERKREVLFTSSSLSISTLELCRVKERLNWEMREHFEGRLC